MEKIIERIIEIERQANQIVQEARAKKENLDELCKNEFALLKQQKIEAQNKSFAARRAELEEKAQNEIRQALAGYEAQTAAYQNRFAQESEQIAVRIFQKITTLS